MLTTDTEILEGLKENSEKAFSALMEKHYAALYRYGRHITKDEAIITDCIQDVFLTLWQNRQRTGPVRFVRQYLLTALKRRIIRVMAQDRRKMNVHAEVQEYNFSLEFSIEDLIVEKQLTEENSRRLRQILDQLSDRQKEVIYLVYYQQLDHQQAAQAMNIGRQSVYNLLHEAIRKIKIFWKEASVPAMAILCF